ncbi:MAG: riboflavin kinase [Gammaproteobacteria bacterium]|nr:riboflavin kinase [Gammaproteobacteria bacterium]
MSSLPMNLRGTVAHGDKRGRLLGVPTANINAGIPDMAFGVYASETRIVGEDTVWPSVTSYGTRPTFEGADQRIETHILDFQRDIYGREIEIRLLAFIRPEQKFNSVNELIATMQQDLGQARAHCADAA